MPLLAQNPKPRVILGLMTFGPDESAGARVTDLGAYKNILDHFQKEGYNEVDTARIYVGGKQEHFTAEAGWKDRGLKLATKTFPIGPYNHTPESIKATLQKSYEELQTDHVDIYYLHAPDRKVPFEDSLSAINELFKAGKFTEFGITSYTAFELAEIVMICREKGWVRPTIYQAMYNAITRGIEPELVTACRRYGLDIVVYNPIAGGFFSGKYKAGEQPVSGRFSTAGGLADTYQKRYFKDSYFEALKVVEPVVTAHKLTMVETAFRWLVHHSALKITPESGGNDGIIMGVSSIEQLEGNLKDCEKGPLPQEVVDALDKAWMLCKASVPNYWHFDLKYEYDTKKALFKI